MLKLKQRGDTIVEVMIVLAMLGLALSISYATANRSLMNTRQAQENAEATELLRGQLEALRSRSCSDVAVDDCVRPPQIDSATPFCMKTSPDGGYEPKTFTTSECSFGSIPYVIKITNVTAVTNPSTGQYQLEAEWDSVQGGKDKVTITYRSPK